MVSSRDRNGKRAVQHRKKRGGNFCTTSGNASPMFQISIFNQTMHFLSYFLCTFPLCFGGIIAVISRFCVCSRVRQQHFCLRPFQQENRLRTIGYNSCRKPSLPDTSTASCSFVLSLFLCSPFPGFRLLHPLREDVLSYGRRGASATSVQVLRINLPTVFPKYIYSAGGKIDGGYFSNHLSLAVNPAKALRVSESKTHCPLSCTTHSSGPRSFPFQPLPCFIAKFMSMIIFHLSYPLLFFFYTTTVLHA